MSPVEPIKIDQLIRTNRRSVSLLITRDAQLIVRAPHSAPDSFIENVINRKRGWITQKQDFFRSRPQPVAKQFTAGENFLFLGRSYALQVDEDLPKAVVFDGNLKVSGTVKNIREHVFLWYQQQALLHISLRCEELARINGLSFRSLKVNNAQTRWGSCGHRGSLNFSWRLIMAPPRVIDYVIIHELMHLKQRNHSRAFWQEVSLRVPDHKKDEQWLVDHGHLLTL